MSNQAGQMIEIFSDPQKNRFYEGMATLMYKVEHGKIGKALEDDSHLEYWMVRFENGRECERIIKKR